MRKDSSSKRPKSKKAKRSRSRSRSGGRAPSQDELPRAENVKLGRPYIKVWNCGATSRNRHELDYIIHYDYECGDEVSQVMRGNVMGYEYILRGYVSQGQARHAYKSFCNTKFCDKSLNAELLEEEVKIGAKKGKSKIV